MPRSVNGSTWPNNGQEFNIEALIHHAGDTGAITFLHQQVLVDPWRGSRPTNDNGGVLGKVWGGWPPQSIAPHPACFVHIRFYLEHVEDLEPMEWARRIAHMLQRWEGDWWMGDHAARWTMDLSQSPLVGVSVYNEMNLATEHRGVTQAWCESPDGYTAHARRELAVFQELDRLLPHRRCLWVSSAPAPGHDAYPDDPDSEWSVIQATGLLDYVDLVGVHAYAERNDLAKSGTGPGEANQDWYALRPLRPVGYRETHQAAAGRPRDRGGVLRQFPQYRYAVTEWGNFGCDIPGLPSVCVADHDAFLRAWAAAPNVVFATSFIWKSGPEHAHNDIQNCRQPRRGAPDKLVLVEWYARDCGPHWTQATLPEARWRWQASPAPEPPPGEPPMSVSRCNPHGYVVGDGFIKKADALGWTLLSDEIYHDPQQPAPDAGRTAWSEALCDQGRLVWHAALPVEGNVVAVPFV